MFEAYIKLRTIEHAIGFSNNIRKVDADIDLCAGRYIVDAKSIMGLFSLDLSKKILLKSYTENTEIISQIKEIVDKYNES